MKKNAMILHGAVFADYGSEGASYITMLHTLNPYRQPPYSRSLVRTIMFLPFIYSRHSFKESGFVHPNSSQYPDSDLKIKLHFIVLAQIHRIIFWRAIFLFRVNHQRFKRYDNREMLTSWDLSGTYFCISSFIYAT